MLFRKRSRQTAGAFSSGRRTFFSARVRRAPSPPSSPVSSAIRSSLASTFSATGSATTSRNAPTTRAAPPRKSFSLSRFFRDRRQKRPSDSDLAAGVADGSPAPIPVEQLSTSPLESPSSDCAPHGADSPVPKAPQLHLSTLIARASLDSIDGIAPRDRSQDRPGEKSDDFSRQYDSATEYSFAEILDLPEFCIDSEVNVELKSNALPYANPDAIGTTSHIEESKVSNLERECSLGDAEHDQHECVVESGSALSAISDPSIPAEGSRVDVRSHAPGKHTSSICTFGSASKPAPSRSPSSALTSIPTSASRSSSGSAFVCFPPPKSVPNRPSKPVRVFLNPTDNLGHSDGSIPLSVFRRARQLRARLAKVPCGFSSDQLADVLPLHSVGLPDRDVSPVSARGYCMIARRYEEESKRHALERGFARAERGLVGRFEAVA